MLVILLDDVGFGAASAFGGPCETPTAERLAERGLSYTRFHTTALCAPTRQALLTGRNHHAVGMGAITEIATRRRATPRCGRNQRRLWPRCCGSTGTRPRSSVSATRSRCGRPARSGPFEAWPTGGGGFEHFYGFLGGETNQYAPALYEGTTPIEHDASEDYHFTEDMTDKAIAWVRQSSALTPDRPFFMYFAPGATHAPHHVPLEWAEKYRGVFDDGWDALRERTFARQKELGSSPPMPSSPRATTRSLRGTTCPRS